MERDHRYINGETYTTDNAVLDDKWQGIIVEITGKYEGRNRYYAKVIEHGESADSNTHPIGYEFSFDAGSTLGECFEPYTPLPPEEIEPNPDYQPNIQFDALLRKK